MLLHSQQAVAGGWPLIRDSGLSRGIPSHAVLEAVGEEDEVLLPVKRLYGPQLGPAGVGGDHAWERGDRVTFWLQ